MLEQHLSLIVPYLLARELVYLTRTSRCIHQWITAHLSHYIITLYGPSVLTVEWKQGRLHFLSVIESWIYQAEADVTVVHPQWAPIAESRFTGKFQLVVLDSVPALERAVRHDCLLTPPMAEHARSVAMLEFFKRKGVKVPGDALTRALSHNDTVISNWMIREGIQAQCLSMEHIRLSPAMIQFFTTSRNFNRMLLTEVTLAANASGDHALVRQLYDMHKMLDVRGLHELMAQSPLEFTEWALTIQPDQVNGKLWTRAAQADRMDLLEYLAPKIPAMLGPLNILAEHGTLAQMQWGLGQASERGWRTDDMIEYAVYSGSVPKIEYVIATGAEIHPWVGNCAINADFPRVEVLDYLAQLGYLPEIDVVKNAVTRTRLPLLSDVVDWCQAHYPRR